LQDYLTRALDKWLSMIHLWTWLHLKLYKGQENVLNPYGQSCVFFSCPTQNK
jgi:hypothetical protein